MWLAGRMCERRESSPNKLVIAARRLQLNHVVGSRSISPHSSLPSTFPSSFACPTALPIHHDTMHALGPGGDDKLPIIEAIDGCSLYRFSLVPVAGAAPAPCAPNHALSREWRLRGEVSSALPTAHIPTHLRAIIVAVATTPSASVSRRSSTNLLLGPPTTFCYLALAPPPLRSCQPASPQLTVPCSLLTDIAPQQ